MSAELPGGGTVGRYRILRTLGSGAMGVVYLAQDPQIERLLAIKTVRIGSDEPAEIADRRERLLREAKTAGRLIHPHVVTLFDAGEQDGTLYLAFEYVEGSSLAERLQGPRPLTLAEALRIGREAAAGLGFAHRQGIVHRDVKPANLLLSTDGTVKISDFGIAKVLGQATELTMTGTVIGSPHYLSPEQVRGEDLDGRSDLFSLGVVLYELLGDRRPFDGDSLTTLLYQILHQEPPPMVLRPGVPEELTGLLSRLLAKDRELRFAGADEAVAAIGALEAELDPEMLARPAVLAGSAGQVEPTRFLPITGMRPAAPATRPGEGTGEALHTRAPSPSPPVPSIPPVPPPPSAAPSVGAPSVTPAAGGSQLRWAVALAALAVVLAAAGLAAWLVSTRLQDRPDGEPEGLGTADLLAVGDPGLDSETEAPPPPGMSEPVPGTSASRSGEVEASPRLAQNPPRPEPSSDAERTVVPGPVPVPRPRPSDSPSLADPATTRPETVATEPETAPEAVTAGDDDVKAEDPRESGGWRRRAVLDRPTVRDAVDARIDRLTPDQIVETGLAVVFDVQPPDSFLLLDGTVIGRASDHSAASDSPYVLPGTGEFRLKMRSPGMEDHRLLLRASAGGPARTTVSARLAPAAAAGLAIGDLPLVRVRSAVGFEVTPANAQIEVDGRSAGRVDQYPGRFGRTATWLHLSPGRHRLSLSAPGHVRRDFAIDVSDGAEETREKIRVVLPREADGP